MKTPARLLSHLFAAFFLSAAVAIAAQENAPPSAEPAPPAPAAEPSSPPAAIEAPAAPSEPEPVTAPAQTETSAKSGELRRLDVPDEEAPAAPAPEVSESASAQDQPPAPKAPSRRIHRRKQNAQVAFWRNANIGAEESADAVVSVFGSSTSAGQVQDAVVSVFGSSTSTGEVGDAVVSIVGSSRASGGRVGDVVVSVLGNTYVNTEVGDAVVAILGNVELGPKAVVHGEVVCIGGRVVRDPAAVVHGQTNNVAFGPNFGGFEWLHAWVKQCLLLGRPLAFAPQVAWAWWIALSFLALYVVLALLFPRGIEKCATTLEVNPGYSILTALLITLLFPLAAVVLAITIIGVPALVIALFLVGLFGKAVMLAWLGRRITSRSSTGVMAAPAVAVLLGGVILLLLYTVPVVGFVVAKLTSWIGIGVVGYTLVQSSKRHKAAAATALSAAAAAPLAPAASLEANTAPSVSSSAAATESGIPATPVAPAPVSPPTPPPMAPPVVSAMLPRAGFWIRIGASLLDILLVAVGGHLIPDYWQPNLLLIFAAYCCVLWGLRGTTIGGIICGLKVVRVDGRRLDWPTAIVRALAGFLSLIAAGIGFIWVAFDDQRQSWHDKIAGTTIVYVPKGVSLV